MRSVHVIAPLEDNAPCFVDAERTARVRKPTEGAAAEGAHLQAVIA